MGKGFGDEARMHKPSTDPDRSAQTRCLTGYTTFASPKSQNPRHVYAPIKKPTANK